MMASKIDATITTILAQVAGHQTRTITRIATASKKRQKQNFMKITSLRRISIIRPVSCCRVKNNLI